MEADRRLRPLMGGGHALYRIAGVAPWHPVPEMRFLQMPIDPSVQDIIRPLLTPRPVDVRESADGEPRSLRAGQHWREVSTNDVCYHFAESAAPIPSDGVGRPRDPKMGMLNTVCNIHPFEE